MKRPRFSLRLLLLTVALVATILAWKHAVSLAWHLSNDQSVRVLERDISHYKELRSEVQNNTGKELNWWSRGAPYPPVEDIDRWTAETQKKLETLLGTRP